MTGLSRWVGGMDRASGRPDKGWTGYTSGVHKLWIRVGCRLEGYYTGNIQLIDTYGPSTRKAQASHCLEQFGSGE